MAIKKLKSGRYQIDFRDQNETRHRKSFARLKDAQAELDEKRVEIREGDYVSPKEVPTFGEMAGFWIKGKRENAGRDGKPVKETTLTHWQNHLDTYLVPTLGRFHLNKIKTEQIEELRFIWRDSTNKKRKKPLSPPTINKLLTTIAAIFDEGIRTGKIKHNPASKAKRLGVGSNEADNGNEKDGLEVRPEQVYTPSEIKRLIEAATPGLYQTLITTVALTGMRHGEGLALMWGDLDFKSNKITVRRTWPDIYGKDGEPIFYIPKSKNATREIPIPGELVSALKRWKISCPVSKWDLVFPKEDGRPYDRKAMLKYGLYAAVSRAGVKKLDMHSLRHSYASILLSQGTPITEVSAYLGHANTQITLEVYSHWLPRTHTNSISRLADSIFSEDPNRGHSMDTLTVEGVG